MLSSQSDPSIVTFGDFSVKVFRAHNHPLQPIPGASTWIIQAFSELSNVGEFLADRFGLKIIGTFGIALVLRALEENLSSRI